MSDEPEQDNQQRIGMQEKSIAKVFRECDTHDLIAALGQNVIRLKNEMAKLERELTNHQHGQDGTPLCPLDRVGLQSFTFQREAETLNNAMGAILGRLEAAKHRGDF